MKSLLTAALVLLSSAAYAEQFSKSHWESIGNWEIFASSAGYCGMQGTYLNGHSIILGEGRKGWTLTIGGPNIYVHEGETYNVYMQASNGSGGTLQGVGFGSNVVSFPGLTLDTVFELARNKGFTVKGVGSFALPGSAKAIISTHQCWQALQNAQTGEGI